jgi:hypothetical protein
MPVRGEGVGLEEGLPEVREGFPLRRHHRRREAGEGGMVEDKPLMIIT